MPVKITKNQPNTVENLIKKPSNILKTKPHNIDEKSTNNPSIIHQKWIKNPPKIDPGGLLGPPGASWRILVI
jgi:hypothetical protein